jgi:signal transduction histidine kinase
VRLVRSLSWRVLLLAAGSGVLGVTLTSAALAKAQLRAVARGLKEEIEASRPACERAPETFSYRRLGDFRAFAYDPATRTSRNPTAPPFDAELAAEATTLGVPVVRANLGSLGAGRMVLRLAEKGPCGLAQGSWTGRIGVAEILPGMLWGLAGTVLMTVAAAIFLIVLPLGRRTRRLREAAARLGTLEPGQPEELSRGDELDAALGILVNADNRIRADAKKLDERSHALERHLGDVAHDLRSPLLGLQLSVEQAADEVELDQIRELLTGALESCVYLASLVENLRFKSLLAEGWRPDTTEPFDLGSALERVCSRAASLGRRRGISIDFAVPDEAVELAMDSLPFERVLGSLVDNAVAYIEKGGHVAVTLAERGGSFEVTVLDDGPGVPPVELHRLGSRAYRSDEGRRRDPKGSGLGLSIAVALCERCGWSLSFELVEPRGLRALLRGAASRSRPSRR